MADVLVEQSDRILKEFLSWSEQNGLILSKKVCLNNNHLLKNPQVLTTGDELCQLHMWWPTFFVLANGHVKEAK